MTAKSSFSIVLLGLAAAFLAPLTAFASDTAKEHRWAEQIVDGLLDGDALWLDDGSGHEFLGILTEGDPAGGRAVLLMHGLGVHPNWPDVIYPLRNGLLAQGVTTLSIQMPILANGADAREYLGLLPEVAGRIDAALDMLADSGYSHVVLVGHSMGASMMLHYLSAKPSGAVTSAVAIGISAGVGGTSDGVENVDAMKEIRVPMLDLYGSADLEAVLSSAGARAAAASGLPEYRQVHVAGANHFFQGQEAALVKKVLEWLDLQSRP